MSSKSKNEEALEISTNNSENPSLPAVADNLFVKKLSSKSFLGKAITIKGDIAAREDMIINGQVKGKIVVKGNRLELGKDSTIDANVFAKVVVINGQLIGDVYASEQATIGTSGRVLGNIYSPDVSIEDGALLKGNIDMEKQDISKFQIHEPPEEKPVKQSALGALFRIIRDFTQRKVPVASPEAVIGKKSLQLLPATQSNHADNESSEPEISCIGETVVIRGDITSDEDVCIQGEFDGVIYFKNHKLLVGPNASIKANIYVQSFISSGEIKGDIFASTQILIKNPGHVTGNLHSPRVGIESGATLLGKIEMEKQNIESAFSNLSGYKKHDNAFIVDRQVDARDLRDVRTSEKVKSSEKRVRRSPSRTSNELKTNQTTN